MAGAGAADLGAGDDLALAALALARRFAAGATMWCLAPAWPEHARHVAVEFVHPVIVGKRALPAVSVVDPDPVAALRATARAGDVLIGVSTADAPGVAPAMRRAAAWGLLSVWIGSGLRPPPGPPTTSCGSTTRRDGSLRRAARAAVPPALGAHPRVLRAPRAAHAGRRPASRRPPA